jgi:hypothetical protein
LKILEGHSTLLNIEIWWSLITYEIIYKRKELLTLRDHTWIHQVFWWGLCCSSFYFCVLCFCVLIVFAVCIVCLRAIIICKSKDRQHNGQKKKDKRTNYNLPNTAQKTKDRVTRTSITRHLLKRVFQFDTRSISKKNKNTVHY